MSKELKSYLRWIKDNYPQSHSRVLHTYADGDMVILHVHRVRTPGTRGEAIIDFFRVENGKIAEHWDVIQPIPETAANANGMFYGDFA